MRRKRSTRKKRDIFLENQKKKKIKIRGKQNNPISLEKLQNSKK